MSKNVENIHIRMTTEQKKRLTEQAQKLNLDVSSYIKQIIELDVATNIISALKIQSDVIKEKY